MKENTNHIVKPETVSKWEGIKFNGITICEFIEYVGHRRPVHWCECHCGNRFKAVAYNIKSGNTTSCGCIRKTERMAYYRAFMNRFETRVIKDVNEQGCWSWKGKVNKCGTPIVFFRNRVVVVGKALWESIKGEKVTNRDIVGHSCGNGKCVNPNHIFIEKRLY